ncbi:MAG: hypothetical protein ACRD9W_05715, partial [Terriglobia bacterium]
MGGKWLEILKEIAPRLDRVAVMQAVTDRSLEGFMREIGHAAIRLRVETTTARVRNAADIERRIEMLAREPNTGLVILPDGLMISQRELIVRLAAQSKLPTIYS